MLHNQTHCKNKLHINDVINLLHKEEKYIWQNEMMHTIGQSYPSICADIDVYKKFIISYLFVN